MAIAVGPGPSNGSGPPQTTVSNEELLALLEAARRAVQAAADSRAARDQDIADATVAALMAAGLIRTGPRFRRVVYGRDGRIEGIRDE